MMTSIISKRLRPRLPRIAAFSTVEAVIAMAIGMVSVSGAFLVNSHQLKLLKSTRESNGASLALEERVEQLRIATWRQITDPAYVRQTYFGSLPKSVAALDTYREQVTISAWPDASVCTQILIEKTPKSEPVTLLSGAGLADQRLAKVDLRITWQGKDGRERVRELTTIISNAGVSRMNLPVMGSAGGAGSTSPTTSSTPAPSSTPVPTSTPAASTPPPTTPDPSTPDPGNGNGNGRGNVAGKNGKK